MVSLSPTNPAIPRCPRCRAKDVIKKGTRTTRHEARQRWGCNRCSHTFINQVTKHSRYPVKVIMEAIGHYNLGSSARETVRYLRHRFRIAVPEKTFRLWYTTHKPICTYHTIRDQIKRRFEPACRSRPSNARGSMNAIISNSTRCLRQSSPQHPESSSVLVS